ncbi:MAG: phage portal protein, partial [Oscillospiraceae bacterium]
MRREDGTPVSKKDLLRSQWERIHMGPSNSHRVAILDLGLDYKPPSASNRDAQFVENKQLSTTDIAPLTWASPCTNSMRASRHMVPTKQNAIEYVV